MEINLDSIIANKQNSIQEAVSMKMLKDSIEFQKNISDLLIEALRAPFVGENIDIES